MSDHSFCAEEKARLEQELEAIKKAYQDAGKQVVHLTAKVDHLSTWAREEMDKAKEMCFKLNKFFNEALTLNHELLDLMPEDMQTILKQKHQLMLSGNILK